MAGDELEFVEWLRGRQRAHPRVKLGIGDDMAIVEAEGKRWLISSDMLLDGVHFDTTRMGDRLSSRSNDRLESLSHIWSQIGRKAIACSLSDCAAMAAHPVAATVSVALPRRSSIADAQELFRGMFAIADDYELAIVGGDTTCWDHPLAIDVTITACAYDGIEPVRRSGAKPGDRLYVTGPLGGSLLGRHLSFTPRVREARRLAEQLGDRLHAMIDISDGLALDLWRMCQASQVGAMLDESAEGGLEAVISEDARRAAGADGRTPLDHALSDGEDFELLLAVAGKVEKPAVPLHKIGEVTVGPQEGGSATHPTVFLRRCDGGVEPLEPRGYVH